MMLRCLGVVLLAVVSGDQNPFVSDINSLSELPLEKLLKVKNTINLENEVETELMNVEEKSDFGDNLNGPQALQSKIRKTYSIQESSWNKKSGKKGLSTLFQISVTSLAFLAFGGYLLCLLVQAIKNKNYSTISLMTTPLKHHRKKRFSEKVWPNTDPEDLYRALRMLSEGYANYYEADFKFYNITTNGYS